MFAAHYLPVLAVGLILFLAATAFADGPEQQPIHPTDPPALSVTIDHAPYEFDGKIVSVGDTNVTFAPPETRKGTASGKAPNNYAAFFDSWEPWPAGPKTEGSNVLPLSPKTDDAGILLLGGLYRSILEDSVIVTTADGSKTFKRDEDYKYNPVWGQIANIDGKLGKPGDAEIHAAFQYNLQRIDLIQLDAAGKITVKQGVSALVCPVLPAADAGNKPLAGIYIAPWKQPADYVVTPGNIFLINPAKPVAPINPQALAQSRQKLAEGKELKIAFLGDSISLGAESGAWWDNLWTDKNLGFPSRVVVALRQKYPKATITPIPAFQGGIGTKAGIELFEKSVLPQKPDLVIIELGTNDADGPIGGKANNPPEKFKENMLAFIQKSKAAGAEVLLVTPMAVNPFLANHMAERIPAYNKVLQALSKEQNVGLADTYTEWQNQAKSGTPPFSQLHNWINHPGPEGHKLYANVILRFFDEPK